MFIQTEPTPNPASLKFIPGREVISGGTVDYRSEEEAGGSPLALRLFEVSGVTGVFLGSDFITVSKDDAKDWAILKPMILGAIMEHYTSGEAAVSASLEEESFDPADAEIVEQIKELIEARVRPVVARDGGDIVFKGFRDGIVYLNMRGSCSGCPSSTMTLKHGIENMMRHFIPEVVSVEAVQ